MSREILSGQTWFLKKILPALFWKKKSPMFFYPMLLYFQQEVWLHDGRPENEPLQNCAGPTSFKMTHINKWWSWQFNMIHIWGNIFRGFGISTGCPENLCFKFYFRKVISFKSQLCFFGTTCILCLNLWRPLFNILMQVVRKFKMVMENNSYFLHIGTKWVLMHESSQSKENDGLKSKIAWLSLNFILSTSWVALYSVVCLWVRHR